MEKSRSENSKSFDVIEVNGLMLDKKDLKIDSENWSRKTGNFQKENRSPVNYAIKEIEVLGKISKIIKGPVKVSPSGNIFEVNFKNGKTVQYFHYEAAVRESEKKGKRLLTIKELENILQELSDNSGGESLHLFQKQFKDSFDKTSSKIRTIGNLEIIDPFLDLKITRDLIREKINEFGFYPPNIDFANSQEAERLFQLFQPNLSGVLLSDPDGFFSQSSKYSTWIAGTEKEKGPYKLTLQAELCNGSFKTFFSINQTNCLNEFLPVRCVQS